MSKVGDQNPKTPVWPWGGPQSVRDRLVDPSQFDWRKRPRKLGDPKKPSLASSELLDFMGPGHTSDELRLPPPPSPFGEGTEEIAPFPDRAFTRQVVARGDAPQRKAVESALERATISPERLDRMRAILQREGQMLALLGAIQADTDEIIQRMKDENTVAGRY